MNGMWRVLALEPYPTIPTWKGLAVMVAGHSGFKIVWSIFDGDIYFINVIN